MKMPTRFRWSFLAATLLASAGPGSLASVSAKEVPKLPPLTTVSGSPRLPGKFVWADLVTDNLEAARTFYGRLFGWDFYTVGDYTIASNDSRPLAGIFQVPRPKDRPDARPRWFGYISVPNLERAQRAITNAGGRVVAPPKKMPNRGEQAVYRDPEGALFGTIKSGSGDPADFLADPGDWIWIQLLSHDGRKAAEFYRDVAGYQVIANSTTNALSDYVLVSKGYARATIRTIEDPQKGRPTWLPFVRVKNINECAARVPELGGKVLVPPSPEMFDGKLAVITDPTGAEIGVMEWTGRPVTGGGR